MYLLIKINKPNLRQERQLKSDYKENNNNNTKLCEKYYIDEVYG